MQNEQMNRVECESNANENNDNDNAFYFAVSHHGTALIAKRAQKPEVVSKTPVTARTYRRPKAGGLFKMKRPIPRQIGVVSILFMR